MKKMMLAMGVCFLLMSSFFSGCMNIPEEIFQFSITSFKVEPNIIKQGETANLSWIVIGAVSVSIDNGIGNVSITGERIIVPTKTTTYTLTATNTTSSRTATTQIIVSGTETSVNLTIDDNDSIVSLSKAASVNLTLKDYGDGGYIWEITQLDEQILNLTERLDWGIPADIVGDFGYDTWLFTANKSGTTTLKLACYRSWEGVDNATTTFIAYIVVKET